MTEAAENTVSEIVESTAPVAETIAESTESKPTESRDSKPAGYDPVDVKTASPEQIEERLTYLYRQVKHSERDKREMNNLLRDQSRVITELSEGQKAVVNHLTQKSFADSKEQLKVAMQEAWKKQDNTAYIDAQNKLMDLQVEERVAARQQPQQPVQQQQYRNTAEVANGAMQSGELSADEYRTTEAWQNEKDDTGNLVRPWAYETDQNYKAALFETRSVLANPRFASLSYEQKLAEVDRRMGTAKRTTSQTVIGGNLTKQSKSTKIELSPKQREIALKTKYAGKGKSDAENLEAYRKQVEKYQQKRL